MFLAAFKIFGYALAYGTQAVWHLFHADSDRIGDAIGEFGHAVTDALAAVFEK